jgi:hypothetical protein
LAFKVLGWRLLKDGLKPAWMLGFLISNVVLFPALFPGLVFGTPLFKFRAEED